MKKYSLEEQILKATKEVVVKFIEIRQVSPSGFRETFRSVYKAIAETVDEEKLKGEDSD